LLPQFTRLSYWIQIVSLPPRAFVSGVVKFAVVITAKRHGPLVTHLTAHGAGFGDFDVMGL
jgi:hypothetical protein